jgi:Isochorismatase family
LLVIIPLALLVTRPESTRAQIQRAKHWLFSHARQLIAVIALVVGAYMTVSGLVRVDELDAQPDDHLVTKQRRSAFHDTGLDARLRGLGLTQVVLTGISTTSGVESTARSAYDHGYHVVLAIDAMTDTDPDAHANSIERIFPKLGETTTTAEILDMLGGRNDAPRNAPQEPQRQRYPFGVEPPEPAGTRTTHRDERRLRGRTVDPAGACR